MLRSIHLLINSYFNKSDLTKYRTWLVVKGDCRPEDNANYSEINRKLSLWLDQINRSIFVRLICTIQCGHRFFALRRFWSWGTSHLRETGVNYRGIVFSKGCLCAPFYTFPEAQPLLTWLLAYMITIYLWLLRAGSFPSCFVMICNHLGHFPGKIANR